MHIAKPYFFSVTIGAYKIKGLKTSDQLVSFTVIYEEAIVASGHGGHIDFDNNYISDDEFSILYSDLETRLTL